MVASLVGARAVASVVRMDVQTAGRWVEMMAAQMAAQMVGSMDAPQAAMTVVTSAAKKA